MGNVPPLAGRSPSYLARQLYDIQHGTRQGPVVVPMLPEVVHMTPGDRIAIVAYLASLGSWYDLPEPYEITSLADALQE